MGRLRDGDYSLRHEEEMLFAAPAARFSTSVTTGQSGPFAQHPQRAPAVSHGLGPPRLGTRRAPMPTCSIGQSAMPPSITLGTDLTGSAAPQLADALLNTPEQGHSPILDGSLVVERTSGSLESTQSLMRLRPSAAEEGPSAAMCESSDTAEPPRALGAGRPPARRSGKERKKVGRPIEYEGDPDAPHLTEAERRRIKRRISNRESARRVRHKRQEIVDEMQACMDQLKAANSDLLARAQQGELDKARLLEQLGAVEARCQRTAAENARMQAELRALRASLQLKMSALDEELDRRVSEADAAPVSAPAPPAPAAPAAAPSVAVSAAAERVPSLLAPGMSGALDWLPSLLEDPLRAGSLSVLDSLLDGTEVPAPSSQGL